MTSVIPLLTQYKKPKLVVMEDVPLSNNLAGIVKARLKQYDIAIPEEWDWHWLAKQQLGDTTYQGTLNTRLTKLVRLQRSASYYDWRITNAISVIHDTIGRELFGHEALLCFTNRLRWRAGAFGDRGSCFWGSRSSHRLDFEANGGWCVRLHKYKQAKYG